MTILPTLPEKIPLVPIRQSGAGKGSLKKEETKEEGLFNSDMLAQLNTVFGKMENNILLKVYVKDDDVSRELLSYMSELGKLTDKISIEEIKDEQKAPLVTLICKTPRRTTKELRR